MSTLGEDLDFLNATVPTIPPKVTAAAAGGHEYFEAVRALEQLIEQRKGEAEGMLKTVKDLLAGLRKQAKDHQDGLEEAMGEAETALESALGALTQGQRDVKLALDEAEASVGKVKATAADVGERARQAQQGAEEKFTALAKGVRTDEKELTSALEEAVEAAEDLEEAIGETQKALKEPLEKFTQKISGLPDAINGEIRVLGEDLFNSIDSLEGAYAGARTKLEELAESVPEAFKQVSDTSSGELRQSLADMDEAGRELVGLLAEPPTGWKDSRDTFDQEVTYLDNRRQPLPGAVEAVRDAARSTGVTFGVA